MSGQSSYSYTSSLGRSCGQGAGRSYPATSYNSSSGFTSRNRRDFSVSQKHTSLYESLGRTGVDDGGRRDWNDSRGSTLTSSWRSRSSEPSLPGERLGSRDYSTTGRDSSLVRNRIRDRSSAYRSSMQPEDYSRIRSTGRDPYPLPPVHRKSPDLHSILVKPSAAQTSSNFNKLDLNSRTRSKSFLDINESSSSSQIKPNRPKRHQTLTFGVSEEDLERARSVINSSSRVPDFSRYSDTKRSSSRHSLPDVFDGLSRSSQDYGYSTLPYRRPDMIEPPRSLPSSSSSVHVSFLSPVESEVALPSFSSSEGTSQPTNPSSPTPLYSSPSLHQSPLSPPPCLRSKPGRPVTKPEAKRDDETLKLLQQHYMNAILTLTPQRKQNDIPDKRPATESCENDQNMHHNANQTMPVVDEILKMWEASQAENSRLKMEMNSLRLELESTKHQLENAFQATNNSVSDTEKEEKQAMEKKLEEMEEKIKGLTVIDQEPDDSVAKLQADNARLREENTGLIRVMTKLSEVEE